MALIKCDECGHEISSKAITCPNCGNPQSTAQAEAVKKSNDLEVRDTTGKPVGLLNWPGYKSPEVEIDIKRSISNENFTAGPIEWNFPAFSPYWPSMPQADATQKAHQLLLTERHFYVFGVTPDLKVAQVSRFEFQDIKSVIIENKVRKNVPGGEAIPIDEDVILLTITYTKNNIDIYEGRYKETELFARYFQDRHSKAIRSAKECNQLENGKKQNTYIAPAVPIPKPEHLKTVDNERNQDTGNAPVPNIYGNNHEENEVSSEALRERWANCGFSSTNHSNQIEKRIEQDNNIVLPTINPQVKEQRKRKGKYIRYISLTLLIASLILLITFIYSEVRYHNKAKDFVVKAEKCESNSNYIGAIANYTEAINYGDNIITRISDQYFLANSFYARGNIYFKQRKYTSAILEFAEAINHGGYGVGFNTLRFYESKGKAYLSLGQYDYAISDFSQIIEHLRKRGLSGTEWELYRDHLFNAYFLRAEAFHYKGEFAKAISDYDYLIEKKDKDEYYLRRGKSFESIGNIQNANKDYLRAAELGNIEAKSLIKARKIPSKKPEQKTSATSISPSRRAPSVDSIPGVSERQLVAVCTAGCQAMFRIGTIDYDNCVYCCTHDCRK